MTQKYKYKTASSMAKIQTRTYLIQEVISQSANPKTGITYQITLLPYIAISGHRNKLYHF